MMYRNTKTGAFFESKSAVKGGRWEAVLPAPEAPAQEKGIEDTESVKDEKPKTVKRKAAKR